MAPRAPRRARRPLGINKKPGEGRALEPGLSFGSPPTPPDPLALPRGGRGGARPSEARPTGRDEIWLTGFGGQGVVLAAYIIGRACTLHAGKSATMIQSFGPEARGSSCSATLVVQDGEVLYPYVRRPNILVAMSAEGYEKFGDQLASDGLLLFERDLVHPQPLPEQRAFGISSTRIAESLGRSLIQNIVMVGFFAALAGLVPREALRAAVRDSVPSGTEELNLAAFDHGAAYADREFGTAPALAGALAAAPGEEARP